MDVETTKYLIKPNVETTKYFSNDGGEIIIEELEEQINDIDIK